MKDKPKEPKDGTRASEPEPEEIPISNVIPMNERRGRVGRPQRGGQNPASASASVDQASRAVGVRHYLPKEKRIHKYKQEDFHVAISDEHGKDEKISGKIHPMMWNEMNLIVSRGNFPFNTVWDLIRVGILELMKDLYELERTVGGVPNYIPRLKAMSMLSYQSKSNREFTQTLKTVDNEVGALLAAGKEAQAAAFVFDMLKITKEIPERSWREEYTKTLESKYGWLMKKQAQPVKMRMSPKDKRKKRERDLEQDQDDE